MKKILIVLYTLAIAILTPIMVDAAYREREYFAIGGEYVLVFTIPLVIGCLTKEIK